MVDSSINATEGFTDSPKISITLVGVANAGPVSLRVVVINPLLKIRRLREPKVKSLSSI
jgi:hypothetical protein